MKIAKNIAKAARNGFKSAGRAIGSGIKSAGLSLGIYAVPTSEEIALFFENQGIRNYLEFEAVRSGCMNNVIYDRVNKGYRLEKIHKRGLTTEEITEICKLLLKSQGKDKEEVSEMIEKLIASCVPRSNKKIMEELIDME